MKRLIKFGSVGLVMAGAIAVSGEAFAQLPPVSQYSLTNATTGVTNRYVRIVGTPRTQIPVEIAGQPQTQTRQVRLNSCGQAVLDATGVTTIEYTQANNSATGLIGIPSLLAAAPEPNPTCDNGTSSLNNVFGSLDVRPVISLGNNRVLINAGKLANNQARVIDVRVTRSASRQRFVSTNACGIGQINLGESSTIPSTATISVNNGAAAAINSLPNGGSVPMVDCAGSVAVPNVGLFAGDNFRNAAGDVFVKAPANGIVSFTLPTGGTVNRSVTSDRCGGITVGTTTSPQTVPFTLNGVTINPDTLNTGLKPNCVLGTNGSYAYDVAASGTVKLSDGRVFVATTSANPTGFGNRLIYTITSTASATPRDYRADACGVVRVRQTTPPFAEITNNNSGSAYTIADMPSREYLCRNISGVGAVIYASPAN